MKTKKDQSFGVIPLRNEKETWQIFLIQHNAGHWSFPKGHAEENESPKEAASRELKEETGLDLDHYVPHSPLEEKYQFSEKGIFYDKTVTYFFALVSGKETLQEEEIQNGGWFTLDEAIDKMTFVEGKNLCKKIKEIIT